MPGTQFTVANITHPYYDDKFRDWQKWRYCYEGGQRFIDNYLYRYSRREGNNTFANRKKITYNPAFAKSAIEEIKNAIFQRLGDITREGGSPSFTKAVTGEDGGVDLLGSSMSSFIGRKILPELLTMSRVGVYVDMPEVSGLTIADAMAKRPYVYIYRAEDIRAWSLDESTNDNEYTNILLRDYVYTYDKETGLATGLVSRFRRIWVEDGSVQVQFYNETGTHMTMQGEETEDSQITLPIPRIPFMIVQLSDSLLADIANYQIALMNLASSDLAYALNANFPFYTEQYNPSAREEFVRKPGQDAGGTKDDAGSAKGEEITVGTTTGRRYPIGADRPGFIAPPSEPLKASMEKQEQLKAEMRQLVQLAVTNLIPRMASAESKGLDQQGLESGLSYIGLELENMERKTADYWAMYEKTNVAAIYYPETYDIKTDEQRRAEAEHLVKMLNVAPSAMMMKSILKQLAKVLLGRKVESAALKKIFKEIDDAPGTTGDPLTIQQDVLAAYLDLKTAAQLRGYDPKTVAAAADDHAQRLERIAQSQSENAGLNGGGARGVPDVSGDPNGDGAKEKAAAKDTTTDPVPKNKTRGPAVK